MSFHMYSNIVLEKVISSLLFFVLSSFFLSFFFVFV